MRTRRVLLHAARVAGATAIEALCIGCTGSANSAAPGSRGIIKSASWFCDPQPDAEQTSGQRLIRSQKGITVKARMYPIDYLA